MAQQDKQQEQASGQDEKARPEEQFVPEQSSFGFPNSLMMSMPVPPPPGTPNSVMREMMDPQYIETGNEGDRFSERIMPGTPNSVMREMDITLGTGLSSVSLHSRFGADRMNGSGNAGAFNNGNRSFSGGDGFAPPTASHELIHTIHDGAESDRMSHSVPFNTVQRFGFFRWIRNLFSRNREDEEAPDDMLAREDAGMERVGPGVYVQPDENHHDEPAPERPNEEEHARRPQRAHQRRIQVRNLNPQPQAVQDMQNRVEQLRTELERMDRNIQELQNLEQLEAQQPNDLKMMLEEDDPAQGPDRLKRFVQRDLDQEIEELHGQVHNIEQQQRQRQPLPGSQRERQQQQAQRQQRVNQKARITARISELGEMKQWLQNPQQLFALHERIYRLKRKLNRIDDLIQGLTGDPHHIKQELRKIQNGIDYLRNRIPEQDIQKVRDQYQHHRDRLAQRTADLPDAHNVFQIGHSRWRMSRTRVDIPGMVKYYKAWCEMNGRDLGDQANAAAQVQGGLADANAAIQQHIQPQQDNYYDHRAPYNNAKTAGTALSQLRNADAFVNGAVQAGVADQLNADTMKDVVKSGHGGWAKALPGMGIAADALGMTAGIVGMITSGHDTYRNAKNISAGANPADMVASGLDTLSSTASIFSGGLGIVEKGVKIAGGGTELLSNSVLPGINIVTGGASAISGGMQFVRGANSWRRLNNALDTLNDTQTGAAAAAGGAVPAQEKKRLEQIIKHGRSVQKINTLSGGLKAAAGAITATGGAVTLATGPLGLGIGGGMALTSAALSLAKHAFEMGLKRRLRKKVVGEELHINWTQEMKDVRSMIKIYNDEFSLRDKDVREIILKAHGSEASTRTGAFNLIKLKRAQYLIDTARNPQSPFQMVADAVIEAMGVHKRGGSFADGAVKLLAEKLG